MLNGAEAEVTVIGNYKSMSDCFTAHDIVVEYLERPIINYRPVCVAKAVEI